jgi:hypothetical protein
LSAILVRPTKIFTLFFALLNSITSAHARIGENVKQIETRYGKPLRVLQERGNFRKLGYGYRGFMVAVSYVNGVSKSEGFARPDSPKLSEKEITDLLSLNLGPGMTWTLIPGEAERFWMRNDGRVVARLSERKFLQVQEKNFQEPK